MAAEAGYGRARTTQRAAHLQAALFGLEVADEGKRAGAFGSELEGHRLPGADALRDAVLLDGEAVRDVCAPQLNGDQIALVHFDARGLETVAAGDDGEGTGGGALTLRGEGVPGRAEADG